jgi:hypothetical protein
MNVRPVDKEVTAITLLGLWRIYKAARRALHGGRHCDIESQAIQGKLHCVGRAGLIDAVVFSCPFAQGGATWTPPSDIGLAPGACFR